MRKRISLMILDDHDVVRVGLEACLKRYPEFEIIGSFAHSTQLLGVFRKQLPDVLLMDFSLGSNEVDGLNLIQSINVRYPECKVLVLSSVDLVGTINLMLRAGARGFFSKSQPVEALAGAIHCVHAGRVYLTVKMMSEMNLLLSSDIKLEEGQKLDPYSRLSPREREVVRCCLDGMSTSQIAEKFSRSIKTVSTQKKAAFQKLGINTDRELFLLNSKLE
ncbi:DNA-binding NarL/FixJ family response regulator [Chromobacterium alkanivorans]|uniref:response regulator transcription factor n=1 Tax=Chromobacterium TaxID=535 RepID=UPI00069D112F|nr:MULTISPECIES: response regulator transcription factor [Chromobacterium]MBN3002406.1 response regulator transcription factor [Chromobacterium alkanivorans]MCS3802954.1 DNA-binding NarL/FixJ family response regulator [Chromobacterium alkanivorans]MCS3817280.1 DNA-binding NarL/FixJ family response regulator [Chromobacterium alkanivorans]MCS3872320.1 DNA-binding NarL/FixJ family response regulator [Chromobacterium alkanivorans]